jgi:glutaconate CoA-transferase subunit B
MDRPDIIVVTDLCVMQINPNTGRLELTKLMPGVTVDEVYENTGFEPKLREEIEEVELPTEEELKILRYEVDPDHIYLKEFSKQQRA